MPHINVDQRMQIGRATLQNVVNVLHNQQIKSTPHNVNGALQAITNGRLALHNLGGQTAIPLLDAARAELQPGPPEPKFHGRRLSSAEPNNDGRRSGRGH